MQRNSNKPTYQSNIRNTHGRGGIRKKSYNYLKKINSNKRELMRHSFDTDAIPIHYSQNRMELLRSSLGIDDIKTHCHRHDHKRSSSEPPKASEPMDETNENNDDNDPQLMELDFNLSNMHISNQ